MAKAYAVGKLLTEVEILDGDGKWRAHKVAGLKGYMPVFDTYAEAEALTQSGKYCVIELEMED